MNEVTLAEDELHILCQELKNILQDRYVVLLQGDIGSGKTTLVRHFVESFDTTTRVNSPTFSLSLAYDNPHYGVIYHYDMYRKSLREMLELGLLDMLMQEGLHFIEWGDENLGQILKQNGFQVIFIHLTPTPSHHRIYEVSHE